AEASASPQRPPRGPWGPSRCLEPSTQPSARLRLRLEPSTQPSARLRLRLELPRGYGERVRDVPDRLHAAVVVDHDGDHVEAARLLAQALELEIALGQLSQLVLLARVDAGLRGHRRRRLRDLLARLDLDEDEGLALLRHEINLADARADVLVEDGVPAPREETGRLLFTLDAGGPSCVCCHCSHLVHWDRKQLREQIRLAHAGERAAMEGT